MLRTASLGRDPSCLDFGRIPERKRDLLPPEALLDGQAAGVKARRAESLRMSPRPALPLRKEKLALCHDL
jgi:hypothetical protein